MTRPLAFDQLRSLNIIRCETGFGHALNSWSVAEWGNAAAGELGEACNVAKKMLRFRDNVKGNQSGISRDDYKAKLAQELADTIIYIDLWAASEGIDLAQTVRDVFNAKSKEIGSDVFL